MNPVAQAGLLVIFPVIAAALGSIVAASRRPGARLTSGVQHFAAGVVLAAVVGEVLPDLRKEGHLGLVAIGFGVGVALLLGLGGLGRRLERSRAGIREAAGSALPLGLLVAVGVDLLIDGSLVGLGATLGAKQGIVLTIALTLEILFLGVSLCAELLDAGQRPVRAAAISSGLGLLTAVGAIVGAALLGRASSAVLAPVLAFGAAALLYLVVEELLVEAHEEAETALLSAMFFAGFLGLYVLAAAGG